MTPRRHHLTDVVVVLAFSACILALALLNANPALAGDVSGRGSYQTAVPVQVPGFHSITPHISLTYDSNTSNGPAGVGWRLEAESRITRSSAGGGAPRFGASDQLWIDGVQLIPCDPTSQRLSCRSGGTHAALVEDSRRYVQNAKPPNNSWTVWQRDGTRYLYTPQLGDISSPERTLRWALKEVIDTHDNRVKYAYNCNLHECLLASITYGDGCTCKDEPDRPKGTPLPGTDIAFYWEARPDPVVFAQGGFLEEVDRRLRAVDVTEGGERIRVYQLSYEPQLLGASGFRLGRSWLSSIQMFGRDAIVDPDGTVSAGTALPALTFEAPAQKSAPLDAVANTLTTSEFVAPGPASAAVPPLYNVRFMQALPPTTVIRSGAEGEPVFEITSQGETTAGDFDGDRLLDVAQWSLNGSCDTLLTRVVLGRLPATSRIDDSQPWAGATTCTTCATSTTRATTCTTRATRALAADFDGDRRTDLGLLQYRKLDPFDPQDPTWELDAVVLLSNGDGTFTGSGVTLLTLAPDHDSLFKSRCATGDPNGDGRADVVCTVPQTRTGSWSVVQGLSDGTGSLRVVRDSAPNDLTADHMLSLADANGDGLTDLMILDTHGLATAATLEVEVGVSLGDGTFFWRRQPTGMLARAAGEKAQLFAADFNGDRRADLLLAIGAGNAGSGTFTRFLSTGGATWQYDVARQFYTGHMPAVSIGDRNGDGLDDVMLAFPHPGGADPCPGAVSAPHASVTWALTYNGVPTLPTAEGSCYDETTFAFDDWTSPYNVFAAQVNGDHFTDLAQIVPLGTTGYFIQDLAAPLSADEIYSRWRQSDINGDGRPDLVLARYGNPGLIVDSQIARADGTVSSVSEPVSSSAGDLASVAAVANWMLADVGGGAGDEPDGKADLIVIDDARQRIITLLSAGDGHWTPVPTSYLAPLTVRKGHALTGRADSFNWRPMDVNGDGLTDLVHTAYIQGATGGGSLRVETLLSQGNGTWSNPVVSTHFDGFYDDANVHDFMTSDVDGDGRADLVLVETYAGRTISGNNNTLIRTLLADGAGQWREPLPQYLRQQFQAARNWRPMEVNGDGRTDLAHVSSVPGSPLTVSYMLSLGNGTWAPVQNTPVSPNPTALDTEALRDLHVTDLDHDGLQDLVLVANARDASGVTSTTTLVVWNRFPAWVPTVTPGLSLSDVATHDWELTDLNGDDLPELTRLRRLVPPLLEVIGLPVPQPRLTRVANGMGESEEILYATSAGTHRLMPVGALARLVRSVSVRDADGAAPASVTTYRYSGATYLYGARRQFAGFEHIEAADAARIIASDYTLDGRCRARPRVTELREPGGQLINRIVRTFEPIPTARTAPIHCTELSIQNEEWERSTTPRVSVTTMKRDDFGNLVSTFEAGDPNDRSDDRLFETDVRPLIDADHFIVNRPIFRRVTGFDQLGRPQILAETHYEYDNSGDYLQPPGAQGDLTQESRLYEPTNTYAPTSYEYDPRGNVTRITGPPIPSNPNGVSLTMEYDCEYGRLPVKVCDGQSCSSMEWDDIRQNMIELRDANNAPTTFTFDVLGRPTSTTHADSSFERWRWPLLADWNTPRQIVRYEASDTSADGIRWTTTQLDGLGRVRAIRQEGGAEHEVIDYDGASDRVTAASAWHLPSQSPQVTRFTFDAAGRLLSTLHPAGGSRSIRYGVGVRTVTDELSATTNYETDWFGRITGVRQNQRSCLGEACPIVESATTHYRYDALDRLVQIVDPAKDETTLEWSAFGPISVCDPDRGCVKSTWNLDGTAATATDAAGSWSQHYDTFGRLAEREAFDTSGHRSRLVRWSWDRDPALGTVRGASIGHVTRVDDVTPQAKLRTNYRYDSMGRVHLEHTCVQASCGEVRRKFDRGEQVSDLILLGWQLGKTPSTLRIRFRYDNAGHLQAVPGYLKRLRHNAAGNTTSIEFQNGARETRTYDPSRGWLDALEISQLPGAASPRRTIFLQTRTHDFAGRTRTERLKGLLVNRNETYTHDDLGRLRTVTSSNPGRSVTFDFDLLGNLTHHPLLGDVFRNDAAHVHAATDTSSGEHYEYDALGRMIRSNALEIEWTPESRPLQITDRSTQARTQFAYDATGRLVRRTGPTGTVWSPNPLIDLDPNGAVTFWVPAEGRRVARTQGGATTFLHTDALGSTRVTTDGNGSIVGQQDYGIWGEHTLALAAAGMPYGFTGSLDAAPGGLVQMGARLYDAAPSQFVSADPIVPDLYAPQSLNRYRYAYNDPVTLTDPSGYAPEGFNLYDDTPTDPEQGHIYKQWQPSDPSDWNPYPKQVSPPPLEKAWILPFGPTARRGVQDLVPLSTPEERRDEGPESGNLTQTDEAASGAEQRKQEEFRQLRELGGRPQAGQVSQQVQQAAPAAGSGDSRPQELIDLTEAIDNSNRVIGYYESYLRGEMSQKDVQASLEEIGNAGIGVTEAGRQKPAIVQKALEEAETFHLQDLSMAFRQLLVVPSYPSRDYWVTHYKIEIERQQRFNEILDEYARGIPRDPRSSNTIPLTDIRLYRGF